MAGDGKREKTIRLIRRLTNEKIYTKEESARRKSGGDQNQSEQIRK